MPATVHFVQFGHVACGKPGSPALWGEMQRWSSEWEDVNCPECLKGKDPVETFVIKDGAITCKRCRMTSHNLTDVQQHYCGHCHVFHDDLWPPSRLAWIHSKTA